MTIVSLQNIFKQFFIENAELHNIQKKKPQGKKRLDFVDKFV
jgi:hypothetical protein